MNDILNGALMFERFRELNADRVYLGHFSESTNPEVVYTQVSEWIPRFVEAGEEAFAQEEGIEGIENRLHKKVFAYLRENNIPDDHPVYNILQMDFEVCAQGIADYLNKRDRN